MKAQIESQRATRKAKGRDKGFSKGWNAFVMESGSIKVGQDVKYFLVQDTLERKRC